MRIRIMILFGIIALAGCDKENPGPETRSATSAEVQLVFPLKNSECNEGRDVTDTESTIPFEWRDVEDAEMYELHVTNLSTSEKNSFTTTRDTISIVLQRATAYSWYVEADISGRDSSSVSEVWKFYNSGEGIQNYAPFPAEILTPKNSTTITASGGTVTLEWEGSDIDDDIVGYDVYFGTTNPPAILASDLSQSQLTNVNVTTGNIYYWNVITIDAYGNESESGVYQFMAE